MEIICLILIIRHFFFISRTCAFLSTSFRHRDWVSKEGPDELQIVLSDHDTRFVLTSFHLSCVSKVHVFLQLFSFVCLRSNFVGRSSSIQHSYHQLCQLIGDGPSRSVQENLFISSKGRRSSWTRLVKKLHVTISKALKLIVNECFAHDSIAVSSLQLHNRFGRDCSQRKVEVHETELFLSTIANFRRTSEGYSK